MSTKSITDLLVQIHSKDVTSLTQRGGGGLLARPYEGSSLLSAEEINRSAWGLIAARVFSISHAVQHTLLLNRQELSQAVLLVAKWMETDAPVRVLGAGRALMAASMPGNRLAHTGAHVSFMGGIVPMPNSRHGGGVISCSASGKTAAVLEAMSSAKALNKEIEIIGLAHHEAKNFARLCDVFIGLHLPKNEYPNPLSALADTEEYMLREILDGIIVMAGQHIGFDDNAWRCGHEDIGATGPYSAK
jgi:D-arabinose 5-phosphate isomerase GutQ